MKETNVWDTIKTVAICICAYFVVAKITATNFDHTELQTGGFTTIISLAGVAVAKKYGII